MGEFWSRNRTAIRFCVGFGAILCLFAAVFYSGRLLFAAYYIRPMAHITSFLLNLVGIESHVDTAGLTLGFCDLVLNQIAYRVKHECTGFFSSSIFVSAVLAFPVPWRHKLFGVLMGFSAFYVFGVLRIVMMSIVAVLSPAHIQLFHVYIMVIVSSGFAVALWVFWIGKAHEAPAVFWD